MRNKEEALFCFFFFFSVLPFRGSVPQGAVAVPRGQVLAIGADAHGPDARAVLGRLWVGLLCVAVGAVRVQQRGRAVVHVDDLLQVLQPQRKTAASA